MLLKDVEAESKDGESSVQSTDGNIKKLHNLAAGVGDVKQEGHIIPGRCSYFYVLFLIYFGFSCPFFLSFWPAIPFSIVLNSGDVQCISRNFSTLRHRYW